MMARLKDIKGKSLDEVSNGAYARCFGDVQLSRALSRVQSLIVTNGYELERMISDRVQSRLIADLDKFLSMDSWPFGVYVAPKKVTNKSTLKSKETTSPDFLVFQFAKETQNCYILEVKDGHEFDTRSSSKEHSDLTGFLDRNATGALNSFNCYISMCAFNSENKEQIRIGFKEKFTLDQIMTGYELCMLLNIDYEDIIEFRAEDRKANFPQFLDELLEIDSVRNYLVERLCGD